jgi:hypothetical protein
MLSAPLRHFLAAGSSIETEILLILGSVTGRF